MVKRKLPVEFVRQELTSYSGPELLPRYVQPLGLLRRVHAAAAKGGDHGGRAGASALLILSLFYVGAHIREDIRRSRRLRPSLGVGLCP